MTGHSDAAGEAWFANIEPDDINAGSAAIIDGTTESPREWSRVAVDIAYADSENDYYDRLHDATIQATRQEVRDREQADDKQLTHAIRASDDADRVANELAERVQEWAGSLGLLEGIATHGAVPTARAVADQHPDNSPERHVVSLAQRTADIADEAHDLRAFVERSAPGVAPNLSALAGPVLAARLIALAGDLESLARSSSGTVQVLGAEDALFAHLRGSGPSPKHGVIFTHEYVRTTDPDERGSAARALAGKLTIAARIDHYAGDRRPELDRELDERIERIRSRNGGNDG